MRLWYTEVTIFEFLIKNKDFYAQDLQCWKLPTFPTNVHAREEPLLQIIGQSNMVFTQITVNCANVKNTKVFLMFLGMADWLILINDNISVYSSHYLFFRCISFLRFLSVFALLWVHLQDAPFMISFCCCSFFCWLVCYRYFTSINLFLPVICFCFPFCIFVACAVFLLFTSRFISFVLEFWRQLSPSISELNTHTQWQKNLKSWHFSTQYL